VQFSQKSWINQSENRYSTLLKTTTNVNRIWSQIRENIQQKYRDIFDKIYEIWSGKPTKQRAKVVLKILDLKTWRLRSVWTLKREMLYTCHGLMNFNATRCYLLNSNVSIRNLFIRLNQRLNNCKLTSKSKGILQWKFTLQEFLFRNSRAGLDNPIACFTVVIIIHITPMRLYKNRFLGR
jgi:hypothetical protein